MFRRLIQPAGEHASVAVSQRRLATTRRISLIGFLRAAFVDVRLRGNDHVPPPHAALPRLAPTADASPRRLPAAGLEERVAELETRLARIEARLERLIN
jgi:hypothetical protein